MKNIILVSIVCLFIISCNGQPCEKLQNSFSSYSEAENLLEKTSFNFTDQINTSKSSWITKAKFYSCDKQSGYFILVTDKKSYIFDNLPIEKWNDFKSAESFGTYYNKNIRDKYKLILEE